MHGAVPLLPVYAFIAWTRTSLFYPYQNIAPRTKVEQWEIQSFDVQDFGLYGNSLIKSLFL